MKKLLLFLCTFLCSVGMWAEDVAPVNTILWAETFESTTNSGADVSFTKYNYDGRSGYSSNATSVTYSSDDDTNVRWSTSTASGVDNNNLWLKKQQQKSFIINNINLYEAKKVNLSFNRSKGKYIIYYSYDGSVWNEWWASSDQNAEANANSDLTIADGKNKLYIKIKENNNSNNLRIDNLSLKVVTAGAADTRESVSLSWSNASANATVGENFDAPTLTSTPNVSGITYRSSDTKVADVNSSTGEVTIKAKGETTITASFAGDVTYKPAEASYTLTVNNPIFTTTWELVTTAPTSWEGQYIIVAKPSNEKRVLMNGAQTSFSSITPLEFTTTEFSENGNLLSITTDIDPSFLVTETATNGQYNIKGSSGTWLGGSAGGASLTNNQSNWVFQTKADGKIWIRVYAASMSRAILYRNTPTFQHYATSNETSSGYYSVYLYRKVVPVSVGASGISSFVTPCALDFTGNDVQAYIATSVDENCVTFTSVNKVPANTPIVVKGSSANVPALLGNADNVSSNQLVGSAIATHTVTASENVYALSGGTFKHVSDGVVIPAGKSYLSMPDDFTPSTSNGAGLRISFGEATTIKTVENTAKATVRYNLAGQRVNANAKGIVIVNGKKMFNK